MNVIDILILAALAVSVIFGMYRGFISGVLSVAALIGAAAAAFAISPSLATWLQGNETLVNTLMYYTDAGSRIKDLDLSLHSKGLFLSFFSAEFCCIKFSRKLAPQFNGVVP